ncbi:hypothetical protein JL720_753 [Aureococcus anophagefferens]|nr:hypothetical protein JL720_753 [Aureococcus anophagefferens]
MSAPPPPGGYQQPPRGYQQPQQMRAAPQGYAPPGAAPQGVGAAGPRGYAAPQSQQQAPRGYAQPQGAGAAATPARTRAQAAPRARRAALRGAAAARAQTAPQGGFRPPAAPAAPAAPAPAFQAPKPMAPPATTLRAARRPLRRGLYAPPGGAPPAPPKTFQGYAPTGAAPPAQPPTAQFGSMSVGGARRRRRRAAAARRRAAAPDVPGLQPAGAQQPQQAAAPPGPPGAPQPPQPPASSQQFQGFQPGAGQPAPGAAPGAATPAAPVVIDEAAQCDPRFMRCTVGKLANSAQTAAASKVPIGIVCQPMALDTDHEAPLDVVNFGSTGIVRCKKCRAYVNPFVSWVNNGRQWRCNVCGFVNDVPNSYFCQLDPETGERRDKQQRPELCKGSVELVAPGEYMVRRRSRRCS